MWEEVLQKLRKSWAHYHIQSALFVNILMGFLILLVNRGGLTAVAFFEQYLMILIPVAPLVLLITLIIRGSRISVEYNISSEQLYWWSMTDVSVGTSLLLFWVLTLLVWDGISILNMLLIYISLLFYIMLIFTVVLTLIRRIGRMGLSVIIGIAIHAVLLFSTVVIEEMAVLGLKVFPQNIISNLFRLLEGSYHFWEIITPVAVSAALIWILRIVDANTDKDGNE